LHGFELTDDSYKLPNDWITIWLGKEYYICHVGRFTTWSPPVKKELI